MNIGHLKKLLHLGLNAFSKAGYVHCQGPLPVSLLSRAWKGDCLLRLEVVLGGLYPPRELFL